MSAIRSRRFLVQPVRPAPVRPRAYRDRTDIQKIPGGTRNRNHDNPWSRCGQFWTYGNQLISVCVQRQEISDEETKVRCVSDPRSASLPTARTLLPPLTSIRVRY